MTWISTENDLILVQNYGVMTAEELAKKCGAPSRSAVVGRAHRLGLGVTREQKTKILEHAQRRIAALRHESKGEVPYTQQSRPAPKPVVRKAVRAGPVTPPIMTFDQCQWIEGDVRGAHWSKCGKRTDDGRAFCDEHHARCYGRRPGDDD